MCHRFLALRGKGVVVDFEQRMGFFGSQDQRFEVQLCRSISGMADDVDFRMTDDIQHSLRVLLFCASLPAFLMNASNADVKTVEVFFIKVEGAFRVEDVDLTPHQDFHTIELTWHDEHVSEIDQRASADDAGTMFGDSQHLQTLVCCRLCHFLQTAVGMS